jgi:cob(I)alamin adenosyltransferase
MNLFYTQTGDDGFTNLLGEGRVEKNDPRLEALGALDEASACLGLARSVCQATGLPELLLAVQRDIYLLMAEVAATPENAQRFRSINSEKVSWLEGRIAEISTDCHSARVYRSCDLTGSACSRHRVAPQAVYYQLYCDLMAQDLLRYLNRLSSFVFV